MDPSPITPAPWLRWTVATLLAALLIVWIESQDLAARIRVENDIVHISPGELIWISVTTIILGSLLSAPLIVATIWLTRRTTLPPRSLGLAFAIGVIAMTVAGLTSMAISSVLLDPASLDEMTYRLTAVLQAPALEEPAKAIGVLLFALIVRRRVRFGVREGIVTGLMVGLAATVAEAGFYVQLGYAEHQGTIYGTTLAIRSGAFGWGLHTATGALLGAAIGAVLGGATRHRMRILLAAFAVAFASHAVWNLVIGHVLNTLLQMIAPPPDMTTNEPISQPHIWLAMTAIDIVVLSPILLILVIAWRRGGQARPTAREPILAAASS